MLKIIAPAVLLVIAVLFFTRQDRCYTYVAGSLQEHACAR
jgi:hypothetical protein